MKNSKLNNKLSFGGGAQETPAVLDSTQIFKSDAGSLSVTTVSVYEDGSIGVDHNGGRVGGAPLVR